MGSSLDRYDLRSGDAAIGCLTLFVRLSDVHIIENAYMAFMPFWLADLGAILVIGWIVKRCYSLKFIGENHRQLFKRNGGVYGGLRDADWDRTVEIEYIYLVRNIFIWMVNLLLLISLLLISKLMFAENLENNRWGVRDLIYFLRQCSDRELTIKNSHNY